MDFSLVEQAVQYHGEGLLSALHSEQGENFVQQINTAKALTPGDPVIEKSRPVIEDRRRALISFIAKKADMLFQKQRVDVLPVVSDLDNKDFYAILPPLECFMNTSEEGRAEHFYRTLAKGDVIVGTVFGKHTHGLIIALVCVSGGKTRAIHDLGLKCFCNTNQIPLHSNHEEPLEAFELGEYIQGVVLEVLPETRKIYISMKESALPASAQSSFKLGLITDEDIPAHHKEFVKYSGQAYSRAIERTLGFMNPSTVSHLSAMMGLRLEDSPSLMRGLHKKQYPKEDYASEIYKLQCGKWAYKSVEQGIQHFKAGNNVEAFQCLNKALQIDPRNVEALVARGALFANNNSFSRALEDFYKALDYNPNHVNAGKYTVETLVAYGKQHQEHNRIEEAIKCFQKALLLNPSHAEAMHSMRSSQKKVEELERERTRQLELDIENKVAVDDVADEPNTSKTSMTKERLKRLLSVDKDSKNDKQKVWPSSSSTSSVTSDSSPSTSPLDSKSKRKSVGSSSYEAAQLKKDATSSYSSSNDGAKNRSHSSARRTNSSSRKRRSSTSSTSSSSSSSYESARRSKSSRSKRSHRHSSSRYASKRFSRRTSTTEDAARRTADSRHSRKYNSNNRKRSSSSYSEYCTSSPSPPSRNGKRKRSSNSSVTVVDLSRSSSRSRSGRNSERKSATSNSKDAGLDNLGPPLSKIFRGEQAKNHNMVNVGSVPANNVDETLVAQFTATSGLRFPSTDQSYLNLPPSKIERSPSDASVNSGNAQVVTPNATAATDGRRTSVGGGKLKELELFLATLKANKIAGKSKV